jgi:hypothetical protein
MVSERPRSANGHLRILVGRILAVLGLAVFIIGAEPGLIGQDRSPVVGFIQVAVFLVGLGLICLGGYLSLNALWNGNPKSIIFDIGLRLVATGYVVAVASGMADIFGFGSQHFPDVPFFGPWQEIGVLVGEAVMGVGFLMMIPYRSPRARRDKDLPES